MRVLYIAFGVFCLSVQLHAQPHWGSAGQTSYMWTVGAFATDPLHETLYYAGALELGDHWYFVNRALQYSDGVWDTVPGWVPGSVKAMIEFHDTLIISGFFQELNGVPVVYTAFHNGTHWEQYGNLDSYSARFRVIDDTLYAVGAFDMVEGVPASGVAKRVGNAWVGVGELDFNGHIVGDIAKYNGELVIGSNGWLGNEHGIFHLVGDQWLPLGGGIQGSGNPGSLAIYQGNLYLAGQFTMNGGNPANNVMGWNGSEFFGMNAGTQYSLGNNGAICSTKVLVHNDLLWVYGGCSYAGGVLAQGVATWDGNQWCGVPGDLITDGNAAAAATFYRDTMFVVTSAYMQMNDTAETRLAKFIGPSYFGPCSGPIGFEEIERSTSVPTIISLFNDQWAIANLEDGQYVYTMYDAFGRIIAVRTLISSGGRSETIYTQAIAEGPYVIRLARNGTSATKSLRMMVVR